MSLPQVYSTVISGLTGADIGVTIQGYSDALANIPIMFDAFSQALDGLIDGDGSNNLDGVTTAGLDIGNIRFALDPNVDPPMPRIFMLCDNPNGDASDIPGAVRPLDYADPANKKIWRLFKQS